MFVPGADQAGPGEVQVDIRKNRKDCQALKRAAQGSAGVTMPGSVQVTTGPGS